MKMNTSRGWAWPRQLPGTLPLALFYNAAGVLYRPVKCTAEAETHYWLFV